MSFERLQVSFLMLIPIPERCTLASTAYQSNDSVVTLPLSPNSVIFFEHSAVILWWNTVVESIHEDKSTSAVIEQFSVDRRKSHNSACI